VQSEHKHRKNNSTTAIDQQIATKKIIPCVNKYYNSSISVSKRKKNPRFKLQANCLAEFEHVRQTNDFEMFSYVTNKIF
jgi:hypothetical protein